MSNLRPVKGTRDLLPEEMKRFGFLHQKFRSVSELYGFGEISTPILESIEVFTHSLGDTSDVVTKQMYSFKDNNGDMLVLRPEGTAGVARAFINEGMGQEVPVKLSYYGPMFRYERPQKGRYRQFFQMGVELIGAQKAQADIETIACARQMLSEIGLLSRVKLQINSIGDHESRKNYRETLLQFLKTHFESLSVESQSRFEKNPLRILDSKDPKDREILKSAPLFRESLNESSRLFFEEVCQGLKDLGIEFVVDDYLVRGFDYYCHTVFEFTTEDLGSQNAVLSGGRYDGLIESLGGPKTPGVGWAAGVDRLALMLTEIPNQMRPIAVIPMSDAFEKEALAVCMKLRQNGIASDLAYSGNPGKRMKRANKIGAKYALILGEEELAREKLVLKNMDEGTQSEIARHDYIESIRSLT
jgi:histidyl-tRNA synthetase